MVESAAAQQPAGEARRVLLSVDNSEGTERAVSWTAQNFLHEGDQLVLFHVTPDPETQEPLSYKAPWPPGEKMDDATKKAKVEDATAFIKQKVEPLLKGHPYTVQLAFHSIKGEAAAKLLCDKAGELKPVAVVMGSHHKSVMERSMKPSATVYMTKHCHSPCIII